jgi:cell division control protein 6
LVQQQLQENVFRKQLQKSSVFSNRSIITPHYIPAKLPFRDRQIEEISQILSTALHGEKPDNLFIYGKVGTGKTVTVNHVLAQLCEFISESNNEKVDFAYVNCRNHNSRYKVILKALAKFFPKEDFIGYSSSFVYEKLLDYAGRGKQVIVVLDEIDKVRDLDELIYSLTRANDELQQGGIALIGISNNLFFKDKLDARTKSALLQREMVFPPYNASELREILQDRIKMAFKPGVVQDSAINLASALAAKETGDARAAVMLMLRAGEEADRKGLNSVSDAHVRLARTRVEEEVTLNMVETLPKQQQLVLYAISLMTVQGKGFGKLNGSREEGVFFSGDAFREYERIASSLSEQVVSSRWFREYVNELETYGLLLTTASGKGVRGTTTLIRLGFDAKKLKSALEKELMLG